MNIVRTYTKIFIAKFSVSSVQPVASTMVLNHNPGLKKKTKVAIDPKKLQRQKERQEMKLLKHVISPPVDMDSIPHPSWFHADKQREKLVLSDEEIEKRALLKKDWSRYQMKKHINDLRVLRDKMKCKHDALNELKKESEFLYNEALIVDKSIFPLTLNGPMETPAMEGYEAPDFVDQRK